MKMIRPHKGLILSEHDGLPPLPSDDSGRHLSWVIVMCEPGFHYGEDYYDVDEAFIDAQVSDYTRFTDNGYHAPILNMHQMSAEREGDVLLLTKWRSPEDGRLRLLAAVRWVALDAAERIQSGRWRYTSGGFGPLTDDRGQTFDFVLTELSLVAAPHLKDAAGPYARHILNSENPMDPELQPAPSPAAGVEGETQDLAALVATLTDAVGALSARMDAYDAKMMEDDPAEVEPATAEEAEMMDGPKVAALMEEIATLKAEKAQALFLAEYGQVIPADTQESAFALYQHDAAKFAQCAALMAAGQALTVAGEAIKPTAKSKVAQLGERLLQEDAPRTLKWGLRLGQGDKTPDKTQPVTLAELDSRAERESNGDKIKKLEIYKGLMAKHPEAV